MDGDSFADEGSSAPDLHVNETQFVELHLQTEHKLAFTNVLFPSFLSIIANAGRQGKVDASRIYIFDLCAGAGGHLSRDSPFGQLPGTPIQACLAAQKVQKRHPECRVIVRAIDNNPTTAQRLFERVQPFQRESGSRRVDVEVLSGNYADKVEPLLKLTEKTNGGRFRSLWLVDPFNLSQIPHAAFSPLLNAGAGVEVIINLALSELLRLYSVINSSNTNAPTRRANTAILDALFGNDRWREIPKELPWS